MVVRAVLDTLLCFHIGTTVSTSLLRPTPMHHFQRRFWHVLPGLHSSQGVPTRPPPQELGVPPGQAFTLLQRKTCRRKTAGPFNISIGVGSESSLHWDFLGNEPFDPPNPSIPMPFFFPKLCDHTWYILR